MRWLPAAELTGIAAGVALIGASGFLNNPPLAVGGLTVICASIAAAERARRRRAAG